jgi:hypothetical protein
MRIPRTARACLFACTVTLTGLCFGINHPADAPPPLFVAAARPWSPTGVAVFGDDVYVLEFTNSLKAWNEGEGWQPLVRRLGRDGKVTHAGNSGQDATAAQENA